MRPREGRERAQSLPERHQVTDATMWRPSLPRSPPFSGRKSRIRRKGRGAERAVETEHVSGRRERGNAQVADL